jgi:hypothetical protein
MPVNLGSGQRGSMLRKSKRNSAALCGGFHARVFARASRFPACRYSVNSNAVTFIDYLNIGENIVTSPSRNLDVESLDDLCERQVALPRGTATMEQANKVSARCVANGKSAARDCDLSRHPYDVAVPDDECERSGVGRLACCAEIQIGLFRRQAVTPRASGAAWARRPSRTAGPQPRLSLLAHYAMMHAHALAAASRCFGHSHEGSVRCDAEQSTCLLTCTSRFHALVQTYRRQLELGRQPRRTRFMVRVFT